VDRRSCGRKARSKAQRVVPCTLPWLIAMPIPLSSFMAAAFIVGGAFIAVMNYRAGSQLLEEAHR